MIHAANDGAVAADSAEFIELWRNVINVNEGKTAAECEETGGQTIKMPRTTTATTAVCGDLQSPKRSGFSGFAGLSHGDSPSEVEPSQDIFWDANSPTQGKAGSGNRNIKVEISDIVNRIAPKETTVKATESSLLQWISDSAVPCTPDVPEPRTKRRVSRQTVDELLKLARRFDENMQQDKESSEKLIDVNKNHQDCVNPSEVKSSETSSGGNTEEVKCSSSSDRVEAELQALFDSSTQKVSGPLSQGSSVSASLPKRPGTGTSAGAQQSELKKTAAEQTCDDFKDNWESDDALDDFFVLEMSPTADRTSHTDTTDTTATLKTDGETETTPSKSVCKNTTNTNRPHPTSGSHLKPVRPKPKSTNRSTFTLESNPRCRLSTEASEVSNSQRSVLKPKDQRSVTTNTATVPQPDRQRDSDDVKASDSLWDDGVEDALLYQVCDTVERISNSQPREEEPAVDGQRSATAPVPIHRVRSANTGANTNRRSSCAFVRSNSVPGTSSQSVNYRGWSVTMRGANNQSPARISQSLPGSRRSLGTFSQFRESPGSVELPTATARPTPKSELHHAAFKRNVTDSADSSNKVFVTSQMMGKCSAVEIERKKQEALARRRRRIQERTKSATELRPK